MSLNDLFYTEQCTLLEELGSNNKPNMYGIVAGITYQALSEDVPCCITPVSSTYVRQKYGMDIQVSFELSMDYVENAEKAKRITYNGVNYEVKTFTVHPAFMCLPKSITFLVKEV